MDTNFFTHVCACTLNRAFGYEPRISQTLIRNLGSISAVFRLPEKDRDNFLSADSRLKGRLLDSELEKSRRELEDLLSRGYQFLCPEDPAYPDALRDIPDAPVALYVRSSSPAQEIFNTGRTMISVVGTRNISPYGRDWCKRIVGSIARSSEESCIVSGLALGVDGRAHESAMEEGLPTIAVLPCGIQDVYPRQHRALADAIEKNPASALVTDYPPGTSPTAITFLRRNRIIAALGSATILVESKAAGGGMITCNLAQEYGRDIFALPGRIDDPMSAGCNLLIYQKKAESICDPAFLCRDLGLGKMRSARLENLETALRRAYGKSLDQDMMKDCLRVAQTIKARRGILIEELGEALGISYSRASTLCNMLQSDGFISIDLLQQCSIESKIV